MIPDLEKQIRGLRRDLWALFLLCCVLGVCLIALAWLR